MKNQYPRLKLNGLSNLRNIMSLNFVSIHWNPRLPVNHESKRRKILNDKHLSWAAKGLGCHLTLTKCSTRFPNTLWDGTMDALEELKREGYITINEVIEAELL